MPVSSADPNGSNSGAGTSSVLQFQPNMKITRFTLPEFTPDDPDTWFAAVEHIFRSNDVDTEDKKFSNILQYLTGSDLSHIKDIIPSDSADKYTQAKTRLTQIYGRGKLEQISRLLNGTDIDPNMKPSIILAKLRNAAGAKCTNDDIFRGIWLQKLPQRTKEMLAINASLSLDDQAKMADCLYEAYQQSNQISAIQPQLQMPGMQPNTSSFQPQSTNLNATQATPTSNVSLDAFNTLMTLFQGLQTQISAIQTNQKSFEEKLSNRTYQQRPNNYRNRRFRSPSPYRKNLNIVDGLCYYHTKFGERAYKCAKGCKNYERGNAN